MPRATIDTKKTDTAPAAAATGKAEVTKGDVTNGVLITLSLKQITPDPATDVRRAPAKNEERKIDALARDMFEHGQIQPIVVRPNGKQDTYLLMAGRRRHKAAQLIEERTKEAFPLQAIVVEKDDDAAWSTAVAENLQREQFSPIEFAHLVTDLRAKKGWTGADWTKHVSDFLHVSRATVSEAVKVLDLPENIQGKVHEGTLSLQAALSLAKEAPAGKTEQVAKRAEEIAESEETEKQQRSVAKQAGKGSKATGKGKKTQPTPQNASASKASDKSAKGAEKGKVKHKHVAEALREEGVAKPRTRSELVAFFDGLEGPAYPEVMMEFAKAYKGDYAKGKLGDKGLMNRWDAIAAVIEKCSKKK